MPYVRSSLARMQRFKKCIELENIESKSLVCLDMKTRWKSTCLMLEAVLKLQKAFTLLDIQDSKFVLGDPLGDARSKVHEEITAEFASIMVKGKLRASEATTLATKRCV